jgi:lambda repressor-like predicted transcriptional regulator
LCASASFTGLRELAERSGVGRRTLHSILTGQRPQRRTVERIAAALEVSPDVVRAALAGDRADG